MHSCETVNCDVIVMSLLCLYIECTVNPRVFVTRSVQSHCSVNGGSVASTAISNTSFTIEAMIRGYHIYRDIWSAVFEELP